MQKKTEELYIVNGNNIIRGTLVVPDLGSGRKCPLAIIMHGMSMHRNSRMFREIAENLLECGIASLRFDFNGHGESYGRQEDMTIPLQIEDAKVVFDYAKKLSFVASISLIGHSQGGVVASFLASPDSIYRNDIEKMVLLAPGFLIEEAVKSGHLGPEQLDLDNMTEPIQVLNWDFYVGKEFFSTIMKMEINASTIGYDGNVCVILGDKDEFITKEKLEKYLIFYPNKRVHLIQDANHIYWGKLDEVHPIIQEFLS